MEPVEIYRAEIDPAYHHTDIRFSRPPTVQDIIDVLTAAVEEGWNGRYTAFGFKDQADAVMTTLAMRKVRAGEYRVFRETLHLNNPQPPTGAPR